MLKRGGFNDIILKISEYFCEIIRWRIFMRQEIKNNVAVKKKYRRRMIKSLIYTILSVFISIWGVFSLCMKIFNDHSPKYQNIYLIMSFSIVTIFIILYCTFTILDKLENK